MARHAADALTGATDAQLLAGANLCAMGDEVLQFGEADPIGPGRFRLSRFMRGWHGTEWACANHQPGERFVLLDADRLASIGLTPADIGQRLDLRAIGSGDLVPAEASGQIDGRATVPPSPVHGRIVAAENGDLAVSWVRRSRLGWAWPDQSEIALGEEGEAYRLQVATADTVIRSWEAGSASSRYLAADIAADRTAADGAPLRLSIMQRGTSGFSRPLILPLP